VNDTPLIDVVSIWSRKRQILDDFVQAARQFYIDSKVLPRKVDREKEPVGVPISLGALDSLLFFQSGALMTATFPQADLSHDWMLAYLVG
jgi:hypothetical protein